MTKNDLPAFRQLAANGQITYTHHGLDRMLERGYLISDVVKILTSPTNQIVEIQSPSTAPGKQHKNERVLISDPMYQPDTVVLICMDFTNPIAPTIVVVTVEEALDAKWNKCHANDPWLVRK